jgi:hypothetical protein
VAAQLTADAASAVCPQFVNRIPELIAALSPSVVDVPREGRVWAFYGSMPQGVAQKGSDVDVLLLHDGDSRLTPHRRSGSWGSVPATIYVLSRRDFQDDGTQRRFGGYFSLKLFSPFVTNRPEVEADLSMSTARFLGPLSRLVVARQHHTCWTQDQLVAHAYLAFLDFYPDFAGYLARSLRDPALLGRVWEHQRRVHVDALQSADYITPAEGGLWRYTSLAPIDDLERERSRCTARFWAFGAVCHEADPGFPDSYFGKTDSHASGQVQAATFSFLRAIAAGRSKG